MSTTLNERKKVTTHTLKVKKDKHELISMLTAYDYPTALLVDQADMDAILVGDSLGMVVLGYENTLPVTMEDMLQHCKAAARGSQNALLIGDMPFMSYQISVPEAVRNAGRFLQEAGMDAVKLEGGRERCEAIKAIVATGIPVMGHIGLTPQSVNQLGGFRPQGKTAAAAKRLLDDALLLEEAGCFSIVLESVPTQLAELITKRLSIPTIGIGAGVGCDGQVLVIHDLLGMFDRLKPRFVKVYAEIGKEIVTAVTKYREEVEQGAFPSSEHSFEMTPEEWQIFQTLI